jgi:hypothetical protein
MRKRQRWPESAEQRRIEAVSLFASIREVADAAFDALEAGDSVAVARMLGRLKNKSSKGFYLLHDMPEMWAYDNDIDPTD